MNALEDRLLELLEGSGKRFLTGREIAKRLALRGAEHKQLKRSLQQLVRNGQIHERRGRYRLAGPPRPSISGTLSLAEAGYGFVRPDDPAQEDLFIPAARLGSAMDGDRVQAQQRSAVGDRRPYGVIRTIEERAHRRLVGFYQQRGRRGEVWPLNRKLPGPIRVRAAQQIPKGHVVEVEIREYPQGERPAFGEIGEVLGAADNPQVDIETVIRSHELPRHFSAAAREQADTLETGIDPAERDKRIDLSELPLVTIDSETARDFDDAVALRKEEDGSLRLWVAIADVAHYVTAGSPLDKDARERGTSVYFPGFCLPMLPAALSTGICSLNPDAERLAMVAELLFSSDGSRRGAEFYPAVMRSRARLTYTEVAACLDAPDRCGLAPELSAQLCAMGELAAALGEQRRARGSLDLDLPEVEVLLDESGAPYDLVRSERTRAHRLIEEFMLAANEAVAAYLDERGWGLLYRIHEAPDPDKLADLQQLAAECGLGLVLGKHPQRALQQLLADSAATPEARLLHQEVLRSLKLARYAPHNSGHFGLAAERYCHFTSPIRRYPDLLVHRVLKMALAGRPPDQGPSERRLLRLGRDCSTKERRAMQAERDLIELRRCQIMQERIGEEFSGTVSSVAEFGFFVELDAVFVEGLVHLRTLEDDFYHFAPTTRSLVGERTRRTFRVGMRVRVRLIRVELWRRRIDFALVSRES